MMEGAQETTDTTKLRAAAGENGDFPRLLDAIGPRLRTVQQGRVGVDGFHGRGFEAKLERERRYGEVYRFEEHSRGFRLVLELPRRIPDSAAKRSFGASDEMPPYECSAHVVGGILIVRGSLMDPTVRRLAAVSPAFPPDFNTEIPLPADAGWRTATRVVDRTLEVVVARAD